LQPTILKTKYAFHLLAAFLRPEVVLDIGSMDGADSKRFARILPQAEIVAFEGNPYNFRAMSSDKQLKQRFIRLENCLVSDSAGESRLFVQRPTGSDVGFNRGTSSTLQRSLDGARLEEVVLDAVRVDGFLNNEYPSASPIAAWVDVEGHSYGVLKGMEGAADRIKLIHIEVETKEIWPGQKLEHEVLTLAEDLGFVTLAIGRGDVQRDVILVNASWYAANQASIRKIMTITGLMGPTASRIIETRWWQRVVGPALGRLLA
jgi:FkbM family methyltransferase